MKREKTMRRISTDSIRLLILVFILDGLFFTPVIEAAAESTDRQEASQDAASIVREFRDQIAELQARIGRFEAALGQTHESEPRKSANEGSSAMETETETAEQAIERRYFMGRSDTGEYRFAMERVRERHDDRWTQSQMFPATGDSTTLPVRGPSATGTTMTPEVAGGVMGSIGLSGGLLGESALAGLAGTSHLYHVGATDFFLDHAERLALRPDQRAKLSRLRERTLLEKVGRQRRIADAEQELWVLTSAEQPEIARIEDKIREIERLRAEQRIAFVRAVGEAASLLTEDQRQAVLGQHPHTRSSLSSPTARLTTDRRCKSSGFVTPVRN
jgi:Spy/CpxP family protein refolding chaperone